MTEENSNTKDSKPKKPIWRKILRIFGIIFLSILLLIFMLILVIRSPWGQDLIVGKATKYVSDKTQTEVSIEKLFITFGGSVDLQGLYLEDKQGDTLVYSKSLKAAIPIWPIIKGEPISINNLKWDGLRANINRKDSIQGYNFQFLADAFASDSKDPEVTEEPENEESDPPKISVGNIDFTDFKVSFVDDVLGMDSKLALGDFHFQGKNFDLKEMRFEIKSIILEDTDLFYEQFKAFAESEDTTQTDLPYVSIDELRLKNVKAHYKSFPDDLEANAEIADFLLELPKADLAKKEIQLDRLHLNKSDIRLKMAAPDTEEELASTQKEAEEVVNKKIDEAFDWPDWKVRINSISFEDNQLRYQAGEKPLDHKEFNPNYIDLTDFALIIDDIHLDPDREFAGNIKEFSFKETSGFELRTLLFELSLDDKAVGLKDFELETGNSSLSANLKATYQNIEEIINHPENSSVEIDLEKISLDLADAFLFQPELRANDYLARLSRHKIKGNIKAKGKLEDMNLSDFLLTWGNYTRIKTSGNFKNLTDTDRLRVAIGNLTVQSRRSDLVSLIPEEELGVEIPESILLQSSIHGGLNDIKTLTSLTIPDGKIKVNGHYTNTNKIAFAGDIDVLDLNLGKLLKNPKMGMVDFSLNTSGEGNSLDDLSAVLTSDFRKLEFNQYDYSALNLQGELQNGKGGVVLSHKDENLDLLLDTRLDLDSLNQRIALNLDLEGADFKTLGLLEKDVRARVMLTANFLNENGDYFFDGHIAKAEAVYEDRVHYLGELDMDGMILADSTALKVDSHFLNVDLKANADPERITDGITKQFKRYWKNDTLIQKPDKPVLLSLNMSFSDNDLISSVFVPGLKEMDTLRASVDFDQAKDLLTAHVYLPYLNYSDNIIDDLYFNTKSGVEDAQFIFGFENLDAGAFGMNRTFFNGDLQDKMLSLNFYAFDQNEDKFYSWHSQISGNSEHIKFHVLPYDLILNNQEWTMTETNSIQYANNQITAEDFELFRDDQRLRVGQDLIETQAENIGVGFENFDLTTLLALFNPDEHLAEGNFKGNLVVTNPFEKPGLLADLGIYDLSVMQTSLGDLVLNAATDDSENYDYDLALNGKDIDVTADGTFHAVQDPEFDLNFNINRLGLETIASFSNNELRSASGYLSGELTANGKISSPEYKGFLKFNETSFNVTQLNNVFHLTEDEIQIDTQGLHFKNFSLEDPNNNEFLINGSISTKSLSNPGFDLKLNAKNFQAMNSTAKDNNDFYGTVNFNLNGTVKGDLNFPVVDLTIAVNKGTDFTYVMSDSEAAMEKQEGIVEFINKDQPEDILTKKSDSTNVARVTGMNLHANIKVDKGAAIGVVLDPRTGDDVRVSGDADLDFRIAENGNMSLTGRYTIDDGHYRMSLYNLVKREFDFNKGGTIIWNGDILDADLDVSATYAVRTAASGLMTGQSSGDDPEEANKFRQKLPFLVELYVNGSIDKPELSFGLDMPDDSRGALGGSVYSRLNQLNEEDEGELNKQVFSLLVMNRFFPESGSTGGEGGFATIARDNLNDALSDQLNNFSDQLMGDTGIKLNFGLDSYTDYQGDSPQDRTDLNISAEKSLFNDRLIVKAGTEVNLQGENRPGEENPLLGNLSIEYKLTEDGRWRIRGFRKDEYENVIDGQVFVNGIGLMFEREFSTFNYLFHSFFGNPEKYFAKKREKWRAERKKKENEEKEKEESQEESESVNDNSKS